MRVQRGVQSLGRPRECVVDAAGGLEPAQGQGVSPAPSPGFHQGVGQQRQYAHLPEGVGHQGGQQGALDRVTGADGGLDDGLAQLVGAHRPDHDLSVAQRLDQVRVARAVRVEVGPDAQHHPATTVLRPRGGQQRVDEPGALGLVGAEGEDLLELVHHQHQLGLAGIVGQCLADQPMQVARVGDEFGVQLSRRTAGDAGELDRALLQRMRPRREQQRTPALPAQPRDQPGPQQRRLSRSRGTEHRHHPAPYQPLEQLLNQPFATEEPLGVVGLERRQPGIRRTLVIQPGVGRQFRRNLVPAPLPLRRITPTGANIGQRHGKARQPVPRGGRRQRRHRIVRTSAEHPISRPARLVPQPT